MTSEATPMLPSRQPASWVGPVVVVAATLIAFLPALRNGFVNWDDAPNFLENPHYRGLGWRQLRWMVTTTHMGHYIPLSWFTLGADYAIWGMNPFGYHLTNLLLHAATAVAFYFLVVRLLRLGLPGTAATADIRIGAVVAALLFAVHPLRVESVAWVTERRDVLSGLLYILALIAYLRAMEHRPPRRSWYRAALGLFVAALMSKSMTVTLPIVLLTLDVYPLRRLGGVQGWRNREVWLEKLPFLLLSAAVSVIAFLGVLAGATLRPIGEAGPLVRLVFAVYGHAFYLSRTVVPLDLSPLYQLPVTVTWFHFGAVIGGAVLAIIARRRMPAFTTAWLVYCVTLLPVGGIFHNGPQVVADRYSYLACLPWAVLAGAIIARPWPAAAVLRAVAAAWILALGILTWEQSQVWRSSFTLWHQALVVSPLSRAAHANLARAYAADGQLAPAIAHWEETLRLSVAFAPYHATIGELYERAGVPGPARERFVAALRLSPGLPEACAGLRRLQERAATGGRPGCPPA